MQVVKLTVADRHGRIWSFGELVCDRLGVAIENRRTRECIAAIHEQAAGLDNLSQPLAKTCGSVDVGRVIDNQAIRHEAARSSSWSTTNPAICASVSAGPRAARSES